MVPIINDVNNKTLTPRSIRVRGLLKDEGSDSKQIRVCNEFRSRYNKFCWSNVHPCGEHWQSEKKGNSPIFKKTGLQIYKNNKKNMNTKKKLIKNSGVKASGSGQSTENNSDNINIYPSYINRENELIKNIIIDGDSDIYKLSQNLIDESLKQEPKKLMLHVTCATHFPIKEIEKLSKIISDNNLDVSLNALGDIDFIEFVFFALCVTGTVNFYEGIKIDMSSLTPIPKNELKRISKKISNRIGVDAKVISKYYKGKYIVDPWDLFIK